MAKNLELIFENAEGRVVRFTLEAPVEPVDPVAISQVMDDMITADIFDSGGGDLVSKRGARIVERNVQEIEIA